MFDELIKYKQADHFFLKPTDKLTDVCNAPNDKAGVYIVYALKRGQVEMRYIGRSGVVKDNGTLFIRQGGIKDRLVNGKRDGELRRNFWLREMLRENIAALDIYWYVTHNNSYIDCPKKLEDILLAKFKDIYGQLPLWNRR